MLNKEKYAKEIIDISCAGYSIAKQNGHLQPCSHTACSKCDFNTTLGCPEELRKWANSEYKEREIDWSKVPVDTPIYVWDNLDNSSTYKRYFAGYDKINNMIIAFDNGGTSWNSITTTKWDNAKIKEGVDCSEWYKD